MTRIHLRFVMPAALLVAVFAAGCTPRQDPNSDPEEGFVSLFNGIDLSGWMGAIDGYDVLDGSLVVREGAGGNLYYDNMFDNFILRFEFRLEAGSNNGVGIRAEEGKDAAYFGMEIQVIDNSAEKYAGLNEYQYHGSIYGVVPALRGYQRPVGEWNEEEILADGNHIRVTLNGMVIVDADISVAAANGTIDGRDHPGLFNPGGLIGFLGHGDRVAFRNIRLKELCAESSGC